MTAAQRTREEIKTDHNKDSSMYDTTPYKIMNGHIAKKLLCDANSVTPLKILVGQAPNFKPASPELVKELSKPGSMCIYPCVFTHVYLPMCIYHVDIPQGSAVTTDVAIQNPTNNSIKLPDTSTVVIGVNEIMPLPQGQMMMGNTTKIVSNPTFYNRDI